MFVYLLLFWMQSSMHSHNSSNNYNNVCLQIVLRCLLLRFVWEIENANANSTSPQQNWGASVEWALTKDIFIGMTMGVFLPVPLPFTGCNYLHSNFRDHLTNEDHWLCFQLNYFKNFPQKPNFLLCTKNARITNVSENSAAISNYRHTHTDNQQCYYCWCFWCWMPMSKVRIATRNSLHSAAQQKQTRTEQCATVFMLMSFQCESGGKNK